MGFPSSENVLMMVVNTDLRCLEIQGPKVMKALLEAMDSHDLYLHRVTQTRGIMQLTDAEICSMVELAHDWKTDLVFSNWT